MLLGLDLTVTRMTPAWPDNHECPAFDFPSRLLHIRALRLSSCLNGKRGFPCIVPVGVAASLLSMITPTAACHSRYAALLMLSEALRSA